MVDDRWSRSGGWSDQSWSEGRGRVMVRVRVRVSDLPSAVSKFIVELLEGVVEIK